MPTSTIEPAGFTLLEMLVVILLLGLTLTVSLNAGLSGGPQDRVQEARLFANELELAMQEAVLDGAVWGLDFFTQDTPEIGTIGYRWLRLEDGSWHGAPHPAHAQTQGEVLFHTTARVEVAQGSVVPEARVALERVVELAAFSPEVWLHPTGELSPFLLRLQAEDEAELRITADLLGRVSIDETAR